MDCVDEHWSRRRIKVRRALSNPTSLFKFACAIHHVDKWTLLPFMINSLFGDTCEKFVRVLFSIAVQWIKNVFSHYEINCT